MRPEISEEEAIRRILTEGKCADYVDVANAVQQQFGIRVGASRVEETVIAMRNDSDTEQESSAATPTRVSAMPADASPQQHEVLRFVESMGGFDAAKAAIADLEQSLSRLM